MEKVNDILAMVNTRAQARALGYHNIKEAVLAGHPTKHRRIINEIIAAEYGDDISDVNINTRGKKTIYRYSEGAVGFRINGLKLSKNPTKRASQLSFIRELGETYKPTKKYVTTDDISYDEDDGIDIEEEVGFNREFEDVVPWVAF